MSSMAWDAYEMGITPELGGMPHDSFYRDTYEEEHIEEEQIRFTDAKEAQEYARANPGVIIIRSPDRDGYIIKKN